MSKYESDGFTVAGKKYEPSGIVHEGKALLKCTCGGTAWVTTSGRMVNHSEPVSIEEEHILRPYWTDSVWSYDVDE